MMESEREEAYRLLKEILSLVRKRREVVKKIGIEKVKRGIPVRDPKRESELMVRLKRGIPLDEGLGVIFNSLILDSLMAQGLHLTFKTKERAGIDLSDEPDIFMPEKLELSSSIRIEKWLSNRFDLDVDEAYVLPDRHLALLSVMWGKYRGYAMSLPKPSSKLYEFLGWLAGSRPYMSSKPKYELAGMPHDPSGRYTGEVVDCTYFDFSPGPVSGKVIIYSPGAFFGFTSPSIVFGRLDEKLRSLLSNFESLAMRRLAEAFISLNRPLENWNRISKSARAILKSCNIELVDYNGGPFLLAKKDKGYFRLKSAGVITVPGEFFGLSEDYFRITIASKRIFEGLKLIERLFH